MTYIKLSRSLIEGKKYTMIFYDENKKKIKTTHFGAAGSNDYTKHNANERDERKRLYLERHRDNENWNDFKSAGALSRWILWSKPTITSSLADYKKKFNLKLL